MYGSGIGTGAGAVAFGGAALGTGSMLLALVALVCLAALGYTLVRHYHSTARP